MEGWMQDWRHRRAQQDSTSGFFEESQLGGCKKWEHGERDEEGQPAKKGTGLSRSRWGENDSKPLSSMMTSQLLASGTSEGCGEEAGGEGGGGGGETEEERGGRRGGERGERGRRGEGEAVVERREMLELRRRQTMSVCVSVSPTRSRVAAEGHGARVTHIHTRHTYTHTHSLSRARARLCFLSSLCAHTHYTHAIYTALSRTNSYTHTHTTRTLLSSSLRTYTLNTRTMHAAL